MIRKNKAASKKLITRFQHQLNRLNTNLETLASQHPELAHLQSAALRAEQAPEVDRLLHGTAMLMADVAVSIDKHLDQAGLRLLAMKNPDLTFWCPKSKVTPWPESFKNQSKLSAATQLQIQDGPDHEKSFSNSWDFFRQGVTITSAEIQVGRPTHAQETATGQPCATHHLILNILLEKPALQNTHFCCYVQGLSLFAWELWAGIQNAFEAHKSKAEGQAKETAASPCGLGSETHRLLWPRTVKTPWGGALLEDFFNSPESLRFFQLKIPAEPAARGLKTLSIPLVLSNDCQLLQLSKNELLALLLPDPVLWCNVYSKALKPVVIETSALVHHIEPQGAYKAQQRIVRITHALQETAESTKPAKAQTLAFHHEETWHQSNTNYGAFLMLHQPLRLGTKLSLDAICTETTSAPSASQALKAFAFLQAQTHSLASLCKLSIFEFVELLLLFDHTAENTGLNLRGAFTSLQIEKQHLQIREQACFIPASAHCFTLGVLPEKLLPVPVAALGYILERWLAGFCSSFEMVSVKMIDSLNSERVLYEGSWKISPTQNVFCSVPGHQNKPR
ncbi:MAG: type VI secretion system baseplate subunit TssF [Burkholderiales bacterium]|nr:type VI secretion system baseplate subunit TssF [Burkholderiales bacterium]